MVLNSNQKYNHVEGKQAGKNASIEKSKELVREIKSLFEPHLKECIEYEPDESLRINKAPAVRLTSGKLAIAPDLKCIT